MNKNSQIILLLVSCLSLITSQSDGQVISRNERVKDIKDIIDAYQENFDYLRYYDCGREPQQDCQNLEVWKNLRSKHSKNITNLQEKLASYNRTIQDILIANKQQISAKNESMMKLFPEFTKLKNDEEQINILIMVVNETYVKSDINNMYATIFAAVSSMQSGNETNETDPDEEFPLIDEDYFEDENETNYTYTDPDDPEFPIEPFEAQSARQSKESEPAPLVADDIPEGKNVKEHDSHHRQELNQPVVDDYNVNIPPIENLNIMELRRDLKDEVKSQGRYVLSMLQYFKDRLMNEQSRLRQEICNFERQMTDIHKKHLYQIIQIFSDSRKIQKLIFEKDDAVLQLDMKIKFCEGATIDQVNFDNCLTANNKKLAQLSNIQELIKGTVKELDKLSQYEDKNVYDPNLIHSAISLTPYKNTMEYTDYSTDDEGKLVSRKMECVVTECREKRVVSEQNFQLLLKKKFAQMAEEELLKDDNDDSTNWLETFNSKDWHQGFNLMDENFGDATKEQEQEQDNSKITDEQIESSLKGLQGELQDDSNEPIESIKNKLPDDVLEKHIEESSTLIMHESTKKLKNKKKVEKKSENQSEAKNQLSIKKKKHEVKKKEVKQIEQKQEGLFARVYYYFFGKPQAQNFLLQLQ